LGYVPSVPIFPVQFHYDYRGRRDKVTDQNGKVTQYAYDDADRLTSVTDAQTPTAGVTQYGYDTENNVTSITDAAGHQTQLNYDNGGQVTKVTFPSTLFESYLNSGGDVIQKTDRKNQVINFYYDSLHRLRQKSYPDGSAITYTYDPASNLIQAFDRTGGSNSTYIFGYDGMNRLIHHHPIWLPPGADIHHLIRL
jgi:YD repeat-containing protein